MEQIVRWWVAVLVTVVAFSAATWICRALALPTVMKGPGIRWGMAAGLGVAGLVPCGDNPSPLRDPWLPR